MNLKECNLTNTTSIKENGFYHAKDASFGHKDLISCYTNFHGRDEFVALTLKPAYVLSDLM